MAMHTETVLAVQHYTDDLFHITTTRDPGIKFRDGEFVMIGMDTAEQGVLLRAYSIASPNHQETLEFYSIKVQAGPLTSRLQHIQPGDQLIVNKKAVGTLVLDNLKPGRNLYLLATGTGIAPFLSLARGMETYDNFENVVIVWGTRTVPELSQMQLLDGLNTDPVYSEVTQGKLKTYYTTTREDFKNQGRVTDAMYTGRVQQALDLPAFGPEDRVMICGSIPMNAELHDWLESLGFTEGNNKDPGDYVIERAFVG